MSNQDGGTPHAIFHTLAREFKFTLDALATAQTARCERFFSTPETALMEDWQQETIWIEAPNGKVSFMLIEKAAQAAINGATVVMLIAARPDTKAWHLHIFGNCFAEIRFIKGRVKYAGAEHGAPYPSAIVIFRPPAERHSAHLKVGSFVMNTRRKQRRRKGEKETTEEEETANQISLDSVWEAP